MYEKKEENEVCLLSKEAQTLKECLEVAERALASRKGAELLLRNLVLHINDQETPSS